MMKIKTVDALVDRFVSPTKLCKSQGAGGPEVRMQAPIWESAFKRLADVERVKEIMEGHK